MKTCLKCNKEHNGSFGSGNYCCKSCANSHVRTDESKLLTSKSVKNSEKVIQAVKERSIKREALKKNKKTIEEKYPDRSKVFTQNKKEILLKTLEWINNKKSLTYICNKLECSRNTLKKFFKINKIIYNGNQGNKGVYVTNPLVDNFKGSIGTVKQRIKDENLLDYSKCGECGIKEWNKKEIGLELHHKNGNRKDNRLENLIYLCPNCHSQTDTHRAKNKKYLKKITSEELLEILKKSKSINEALKEANMSTSQTNYARAKRLVKKFELFKEDNNPYSFN